MISLQDIGLSHSEIPGSKVICTSPGLIAAYHVLHRLREPRHPPCALSYFLFYRSHCFCSAGDIYFQLVLKNITFCFVQYVIDRLSLTFLMFRRTGWRITDSNRWPPACKAGALASWANPPILNWKLKIENWKLIVNYPLSIIHSAGSPRQSWTADLYIISVAL